MFLNLQSSMVVHTFSFLFETILMCQLPESCLANKKKIFVLSTFDVP